MRGECTKLTRDQRFAIAEEIAIMLVKRHMTRDEIVEEIGISPYQYINCLRKRYTPETVEKLIQVSKSNAIHKTWSRNK